VHNLHVANLDKVKLDKSVLKLDKSAENKANCYQN